MKKKDATARPSPPQVCRRLVDEETVNPYHHFVSEYARFMREGKSYPLGGFPPAPKPAIAENAPKVLIFSPHPDDECVIGALALRLLREAKMNVINVAVTQGRKKERQTERWQELKAACHHLGFGLRQTAPGGLEKITVNTRAQEPAHWAESVKLIAAIVAEHQPRVIFFPHAEDWNSTHIGTHFLVMDALKTLSADFECYVVETEYWGQMNDPNLMVEMSPEDLADMITALSFHVGEVKRNPYHLLVPAWMMDNVRRSEIVCGQGSAAPDFIFATLYRQRKWTRGRLENTYDGGKQLARGASAGELFL